MIEFSPAILSLVPLVIGLTALAKLYVPSRWAPVIAIGLGLAGAFLFPAATMGLTIVSGIVVGLTASGLYSGVKSIIKDPTPEFDA